MFNLPLCVKYQFSPFRYSPLPSLLCSEIWKAKPFELYQNALPSLHWFQPTGGTDRRWQTERNIGPTSFLPAFLIQSTCLNSYLFAKSLNFHSFLPLQDCYQLQGTPLFHIDFPELCQSPFNSIFIKFLQITGYNVPSDSCQEGPD